MRLISSKGEYQRICGHILNHLTLSSPYSYIFQGKQDIETHHHQKLIVLLFLCLTLTCMFTPVEKTFSYPWTATWGNGCSYSREIFTFPRNLQRLENTGLQLVLLIKPWFGGLSRICLLLFVLQASGVKGAELVPAARLPADSAACHFFLPVS